MPWDAVHTAVVTSCELTFCCLSVFSNHAGLIQPAATLRIFHPRSHRSQTIFSFAVTHLLSLNHSRSPTGCEILRPPARYDTNNSVRHIRSRFNLRSSPVLCSHDSVSSLLRLHARLLLYDWLIKVFCQIKK